MDILQIVSKSNAMMGEMGQTYLASGKQVALRCWDESPGEFSEMRARDYETVGYVISGELKIDLDGQIAELEAGDSWLVPEGSQHRYQITKTVVAIEATSPPARFNGKDEPVE